MKEQYLCKAKDYMTDEWVIGSLIVMDWDSGYVFIAEPYKYVTAMSARELLCNHTRLVKKETICRCTGLQDAKENLIWENDIVETPREDGYALIFWSDTEARWEIDNKIEGVLLDFDNYWSYEVMVVGNYFDSPELLEVE